MSLNKSFLSEKEKNGICFCSFKVIVQTAGYYFQAFETHYSSDSDTFESECIVVSPMMAL